MQTNPLPPQEPLRIVVSVPRSSHIEVDGFLGRRKLGALVLTRTASRTDLRPLPDLPVWVVENVAVRAEALGKGYGTQLYVSAFAAAVEASGGPVIVGAAQDVVGYIRTSSAARRVWERLRQEYPSHPQYMAVRFGPEDIEPWMLPRSAK